MSGNNKNELTEAEVRKMIHGLTEKVEEGTILRRVWKILERAYAAQGGNADE